MPIPLRIAIPTFLSALLFTLVAAEAAGPSAWQGTWVGTVGRQKPWPISITIADGKVVKYSLDGEPFAVQFSRVTRTEADFGDRDNYLIELERVNASTAFGKLHSREGDGRVSLVRQ